MTIKRKSEAELERRPAGRPTKRQRQGGRIQLFDLSDELLLRTLSYLQIESLTACQLVCRKLGGLANDGEIWREKYYNQFVRHRAKRLPAIQAMTIEEQENGVLHYSSRRARWLDHSHLAQAGADTNWKRAYKVKYNWTRGRARTSEVPISCAATPAVLAQVDRGRLYTADQEHGLRIWKNGSVLHSCSLTEGLHPSALAVDREEGRTQIAVGYTNGSLSVISFDGLGLTELTTTKGSPGSSIDSLGIAWPYLMTMSRSMSISLFQCSMDEEGAKASLKCLANLHSDAELAPACLSLRKTSTTLVAGIAYAFNRFNTGWCLGLQEIRMDLEGSIMDNRTTTSISGPTRSSFAMSKEPKFVTRSASTSPFGLHPQLMRAPNSLSYCGCYVLAGLPDNTLMVYIVTSTDDKLEINVGRRLWGHTSAVSAAEVTSTGKALSISANSDEMRYWELEELLSSYSQKRTSTPIQPLNMLNKAINRRGDGLGLALQRLKHEAQLTRRCVSFDDEQAVVVGERDQRQIISCFDFA
ncbi:hypothetical protein LTR70_003530 [Exophiala xenobiotica]|uniref:F-box domain-containing protein n=1 Tax=Lithohypha guttulata TaxID=1690604 RepID=A0ABR0KG93_9EURO|nr:hypothetical protein LTR24_003078 [Lithohypha guttulata]KAK5322909.1 hypothetical protein LTR70_003530 [Exophiala xenobiotica]